LADTQEMLGHLGINVPDLAAAKRYYDALMPLVGFETFFAHYYATFWLDPFGIKLEAVCHHDRH
jgi:catechol 2,3-dioxygenase-like lactoylglutathione lyase family enzyme